MGNFDPRMGSPVAGGSARNEQRLVVLQPFEEIVGRLERLEETDAVLVVELNVGILQFPSSSREATICKNRLEGQEDERISILRTQSPETPILIQTP